MRHIIPAAAWESEMDSTVHGRLSVDVTGVDTTAQAELTTFLILCVCENSWLQEFAMAVAKTNAKNKIRLVEEQITWLNDELTASCQHELEAIDTPDVE